MFCDLVGSTRLSTQLDPEEHHEVLRTYQSLCSRVINRYDGYIAQFLGDGIMAYFGYPKAHEDDAERAVLSGLDIIKEIANLSLYGQNIRTRAGIATGLVVVGDRIAKGHEWEIGVVGETPNLAARIQGLAQPGQVVIGPTTRHLLGNQFDYEELGSHPLKGFALPVSVWRVAKYRMVESRYKAVRATQVKLVDRRDEQALLRNLGAKVCSGEGQIVLIGGEAGIGKSRLVSAIAEWMNSEYDACLVEMQCSALHTQSALFPIINFLSGLIYSGEKPSDPELAFNRLSSYLQDSLKEQWNLALPLFANLLSIPLRDGVTPIALPPTQQRQLVSKYLLQIIVYHAQGRRLLLLIEDLHWADPSTLEFADFIADQGSNLPLMALFTSRLGFVRPWDNQPHVTLMPLKRLPNEDAVELVVQTLGSLQLGLDLIQTVVAKTDGIPLFLQEYTKAVSESQREGATQNRRVSAIPSTLHDLLLARLDRLGEAKTVAQHASLLGREFDGKLLQAIWESKPEVLMTGLEVLLREEVIYPKGEPAKPRYVFRHALIQDAAYESLLKSNRAALHRRIGEVCEASFPEMEAEWFALHFSSGNIPDKAAQYWEKAGLRAIQLAAFAEAARHFEAALKQLELLPESPMRHGWELGMRIQLALSLTGSKGYAIDEVEATYTRARTLCGYLGDTAEMFPILRGLVSFYIVRCELDKAVDLAQQCWRIGEETQKPEYQIEACDCLGYVYGYGGELELGIEWLQKGVSLYQKFDGHLLQYSSAHDPCMSNLSLLIMLRNMKGEYQQAKAVEHQLIEFLKEREHPFNAAYGYSFLALGALISSQYPLAVEYATISRDVSERLGFQLWMDAANALLSSAQGQITPNDQAVVAQLEKSIQARKVNGVQLSQDTFHLYLAQNYRLQGKIELALQAINEPFNGGSHRKCLVFLPECYRVRGELNIMLGDADSGIADLLEAITSARNDGARLFQLRASLSLAQNAPHSSELDTFGLLHQIVGEFTAEQGELIPEWKEAICLLDALTSTQPDRHGLTA